MDYNRSQIHALGKRIRKAFTEGLEPSTEDWTMLQDYRTSYKETIAEVFKILYAIGLQVDNTGIVTYRIKRLNSIMRKLSRFPDMPLDRLVDIAGCRCIVQTQEQIYQVLEKLKTCDKLQFDSDKDVKDYVMHPQKEGYRSLHVYVSLPNDSGRRVEIQIRNREMHNWSTLLEITDTIIDEANLKEYNEPQDLLEFHQLLSVPMSGWTVEQKKQFFDVLKKYDYINKLNKIFAANIDVQYNWITTYGSRLKTFYLIQYDSQYRTKISSYQSFKEAEEAYFKCFIEDGNSNVVLTQIQNATFDQISMAYSNYVLSTHRFIDDIMAKLMEEIKSSIDRHDLERYRFYLHIYFNALHNQIDNLNKESRAMSEGHSAQKVQQTKTKDCLMDIQKKSTQIRSNKTEIMSYYREISNHFSLFYLRAKYATRIIAAQNHLNLI